MGHGVRARQVLGPLELGLAPTSAVIAVRRYRCRACTVVCAVVPRGVLHGRWYGAVAIALALGLMVLEGKSTPAIHKEVSPYQGAEVSARRGWAQLSRWSRCAARLFAVPRPVRDDVAEVLSQLSSMCAPPAGTSPLEQVLLGAMRIAPSRRPLPRPP